MTVRVGEPLMLTRQASGRIDRQELASGTDRIMHAIAALLPPAQRGRFGETEGTRRPGDGSDRAPSRR